MWRVDAAPRSTGAGGRSGPGVCGGHAGITEGGSRDIVGVPRDPSLSRVVAARSGDESGQPGVVGRARVEGDQALLGVVGQLQDDVMKDEFAQVRVA